MVLLMKSMTSWLVGFACLLLVQGCSPLFWGVLEFFGVRSCSYLASFSLRSLISLSRWSVGLLYLECSLGRWERFVWLPRRLPGRESLFGCGGFSRCPSGVKLRLYYCSISVMEKPWRVANHFAQKSGSLLPIVGSMSICKPFGIICVSRHSLRKPMCDE